MLKLSNQIKSVLRLLKVFELISLKYHVKLTKNKYKSTKFTKLKISLNKQLSKLRFEKKTS